MDRNLALEVVRVTEAAALAASSQMGRGDEKAADQAAVDAMRKAFDSLAVDGTVVIGEGERDAAPMLYIGEKVGHGGPKIDIALDPLEGTTITAQGGPNALAVIAMAEDGGFLNAPDTYMQKIAAGNIPCDTLDLNDSVANNIKKVARIKQIDIKNFVVCIMNRSRHTQIIEEVRTLGARISLIQDGDVSGVIATAQPDTGIHMYIGTGGAPEGVLAAAALRCLGGDMQGKLIFRHEDEKKRARRCGISDYDKVYALSELASEDVMFAATGVTSGQMLKGIRHFNGGAHSQSIVMRSRTKTVRTIDTVHRF